MGILSAGFFRYVVLAGSPGSSIKGGTFVRSRCFPLYCSYANIPYDRVLSRVFPITYGSCLAMAFDTPPSRLPKTSKFEPSL